MNNKKKNNLKLFTKKKYIIQKNQNNYINFCAPIIWKKIFLFKQSFVFKMGEKSIYTRSSVIPNIFSKSFANIHLGKGWQERFINKWMVGYKFGEFTWNRKLALYKAKQLKKKKKK